MVISRSPYRLKPYLDSAARRFIADFAGVREHGTSDNLVLEVEGECAILHDERQQVENVLGVELARVLSERGWDVERPQNDCRPDRYRFSSFVPAQLPPPSAPRSTITAPGFIAAI